MNNNRKINVYTRKPASYRYGEKLPADSAMLEELLKGTEFQQLFESFYNLVNIPVAIIDFNANVLFSSPWQRICTQYHRVHPATCDRCIESDTQLATQLQEGKNYAIYSCRNGLTDSAAPIVIEGKRIANVFIGQFLTKEPDENLFRQQAEEFGFDVADYLAALHEVPIVEAKKVPLIIDLLMRMTSVITNLAIDRKRATESQARQSIILNTIPQSVFWKDTQGKYLGCNTPFAKAAGLATPGDIVGKTDFDLPWPRQEAEAYRADDLAVISANQAKLHIEEPLQQADGSRIVIDTSKVPLVDAGNIPYGIVGIYEDITERKRIEESLRQTETYRRMLFESARDAILIMQNDRFVDCNPSALSLYGTDRESFIGHAPYEFSPACQPDGRPSKDSALEKIGAALNGTPQFFEWKHQRLDGTLFDVEVSLNRVDFGNELLIQAIVRDISERKQADEALHESEERFRTLSDNALVGVDIIQDNRFIYVNPAFAAVFGYQPDELIGINPLVVIHPDDQALVAEQIKRRISGEIPAVQYEFRGRCKNGDTRYIEVFSVQISLSGRPAIVANLLDVTERKRAEANIQKLTRLYATLSHTNTTIVHSTRRDDLFLKICNGAVEHGKFLMAWVGLVDEATRMVKPVCHYGDEQGYLSNVVISTEDVPEGRGPTGTAIRNNCVSYVNDFATSEGVKPWREAAEKCGFHGAAGIPLRFKDKVIGALTIYAGETDFFDADQLKLLEEMSVDISFALDNISNEAERIAAGEQLKGAYERLKKTLDDTVITMAKIVEMRDPYTAGHQERVASLAVAIAKEMNLGPDQIDRLRMAAIIHDIGKINIAAEILSKPGELSNLELQMIMTHAQSGYEIVKNMNFLPEVAQAILQHHERLDGSGYPNGLKGNDICIEAKILAVADVVEAIASHRPYRPARGIDAALAEISKNSGKFYDPVVCNACLKLFKEKRFGFDSDESMGSTANGVDLKSPVNVRSGSFPVR